MQVESRKYVILQWSYLYVPQEVFTKIDDIRLETLESLCEPAKQGLISEKIEAPLSLEKGNLEKLTTEEFIAEKDLSQLPPKCKKGIQEAIALFAFLEKKSDVSYAAVFTPLLGSIDEAAKANIVSTLKESIPEDAKRRERFFEPDLTVLHPRDQSFYRKQENNLKRTLIENDSCPWGS
jgi:type III restriction enzyme